MNEADGRAWRGNQTRPSLQITTALGARVFKHRAAAAWHELSAEHIEPTSIRILQRRRGKAFVCRLLGVGTAGTNVVAKRCDREAAEAERLVYGRITPHLAVSMLRYHGSVVDEDREHYWLFLEDAGDAPYVRELEEHRNLAGYWLGAMHGSASRIRPIDGLGARTGASYLDLLKKARESTLAIVDHPVLSGCDVTPLKEIVHHLDALELGWPRVERFCERMPRTLVHGDLGAKNARVRPGRTGNSLLVMDWEKAGLGVPAIDLAQSDRAVGPQIAAYWSAVRSYWPHLDLEDMLYLADYGTMFRLVNAVAWVNEGFFEWLKVHATLGSPEWYVSDLHWYELELADWVAKHA